MEMCWSKSQDHMPLYEYQCDACGHRFEKIRKHSDPPIDTCPKCGGAVHKLQSAPAFQFKGSGWYVTDYGKKEGGKGKADSSQESSATEKGDKSASKEKTDTADKKPAAASTSPAKTDA